MKATFSPAISLNSSAEMISRRLPQVGPSLKEHCIPRAAVALGQDPGFFAASQRLAQRRSIVSRQDSALPEAVQSKLGDFLPAGHSGLCDRQGYRSPPLQPRPIQQYRALAEADQERSQLTAQAQFETHDLDDLLLGDLAQQLQRYPIERAELVKKTLRFFPEQPLYVLLVTAVKPENKASENRASEHRAIPQTVESTLDTQIAQELRFNRELLVCLVQHTEPALIARIQGRSTGNLLEAV